MTPDNVVHLHRGDSAAPAENPAETERTIVQLIGDDTLRVWASSSEPGWFFAEIGTTTLRMRRDTAYALSTRIASVMVDLDTDPVGS